MPLEKLQLKVYVDKYGNNDVKNTKNVLFPLYKASNEIYELNLITEISGENVYVYFEKPNEAILGPYEMNLQGVETINGSEWNIYKFLIPKEVLQISFKEAKNILGFSFFIKDKNQSINTECIYIKCSYSILY